MKNKNNKQKGFSMLEIVIVVALVAIAFVGIVKIMNKTTQLRYLTRNDFIAQGLAKEGIELVEQLRNDNVANGVPFWNNLMLPGVVDNDTRIIRLDYNGSSSILDVPSASDAVAILKFDISNFYQYTSGSDSKFGRAITLTYQDDASTPTAYMEVKSDVYWEYKGDGHTYTIETRAYDTE